MAKFQATGNFALTWDKYQSNMCSGFSSLQQNGDFVDMTLAADGYLVKVHQLILGLASPYLKELIQSAPCKHPVIFLNNVNHRTLCSILEYIYTGEACVPADNINIFFETAKALHIKGLEGMLQMSEVSSHQTSNVLQSQAPERPQVETAGPTVKLGSQTLQVKLLGENETAELRLPANARNICITREVSNMAETDRKRKATSTFDSDDGFNMTDKDQDYDVPAYKKNSIQQLDSSGNSLSPKKADIQYTVSNRGALQLILNRYLYNFCHKSRVGPVRRWRCVEYRNKRCMAAVTTEGDVVTKRTNMHNHGFHDRRILSKIEKKAVYSAIQSVEGVKISEDDDNEEYID